MLFDIIEIRSLIPYPPLYKCTFVPAGLAFILVTILCFQLAFSKLNKFSSDVPEVLLATQRLISGKFNCKLLQRLHNSKRR